MSAPSAPFVNKSERTGPTESAPLLGANTAEVVRELLGLDDSEIASLTEDGVFW
jgi:crotonobetainyl-CoA:carnitine CoA-transferase CaiB-like acyl-CoA transferase